MASPPTRSSNTSIALKMLLLLINLNCSRSASDSSSEAGECSPQLLLPLAPCLAFVQGIVSSPSELCCNGFVDLYVQHSKCLCALLNDTAALPVNRTLVLRLPLLCSLNSSTTSSCPGPGMLHLPPSSPGPQVHPDSGANSTAAAPPLPATKAPPLVNLYHSGSMQPQALGGASLVMAIIAAVLMEIFISFSPQSPSVKLSMDII